ncbi:MAG: alpha-glucan family phosphorylase [Elusimicrobia bacterium]|nr:alpha-glucan family phosphorylase [Elusimicrobiota bacterium]
MKEIIAYFSMEIGLGAEVPTYSGGLGILAGDTLRAAADLGAPVVAVTLLNRKGYFHQTLTLDGTQEERPVLWEPSRHLQELPQRVAVEVFGRRVLLRLWTFEVLGIGGRSVPVYFLDSNLPENDHKDQGLTDHLYGGDAHYRLSQEIILGIGGVRALKALGYHQVRRYHMNEGHSSLLTLELLADRMRSAGRHYVTADDERTIRRQCVFTTHTPVEAGHDQFDWAVAAAVIARMELDSIKDKLCHQDRLNMTHLALHFSGYTNGVSKKHGEVSRMLLNRSNIDAITNGVHAATWVADSMQRVFDQYCPGWRQDNMLLRRQVLDIAAQEIWKAHLETKRHLLSLVEERADVKLDERIFTIGFARRSTAYKRNDLVFDDLDALKRIAQKAGAFQLVFAGKAHPRDEAGKQMIRRVIEAMGRLKGDLRAVYLPNYDIALGKAITAGCDLWLNNPQPPLEASGTSGMKAALNGVPSLSTLDGWWLEGCFEGLTGWAIGSGEATSDHETERARDAASLYQKLEKVIIPAFYENGGRKYWNVMRQAIAINGSYFNAQRMLQEYVAKAYFCEAPDAPQAPQAIRSIKTPDPRMLSRSLSN